MTPSRIVARLVVPWLALTCVGPTMAQAVARPADRGGVLPADASGRPLNFDFEAGTLRDWTADGPAFANQPVEGDLVARRRADMKSGHAGRFWIGTYERAGDAPRGTLTSAAFVVAKPFASFLVAGGPTDATRVEIVRNDTRAVVFKATGDETEDLKPVVADLTAHVGKEVVIRLVDDHEGHWGHLNFDDFRLHDSRPNLPTRPTVLQPDVIAHDGLSPADAARAMTLPPGFRATLFAGEPDVVQPIAMAIDDRGRVWVAEAYSYPKHVPDDRAKDRILIFEDEDGDGRFDSRKVFAEKLNLVSGLEVGFGGVWVGAAPNLLFFADADGDDRPDGPPTVLLDGWGYQDTHETLNSFIWGPDGWLYGCHGVFTHSRVGKPGTPDDRRIPINAGIWRYHPTRHTFEVFAHGTSNPWGVDFDQHGQAFETACVIPHLYHMIQGGRYERQAGQHFNPYTYDDIKTIADHRHYLGATPHAGNNRSDSAGGGHAHAGALIYLGDSFPPEYRGSLLMNNIHGARLNRDVPEAKGSGFVGRHAPDFLLANDRWSQIVSLKPARDGGVYLIDWYDKNQCHHNETNLHDRTNGRIFKITYGDPAPARPAAGLDAATLASEANRHWESRHRLRRLAESAATVKDEQVESLRALAFGDPQRPAAERLYGLWGLHAIGRLDDAAIGKGLGDPDPYLRAWTIQLACETGSPAAAILRRFAELAQADPSPVVRLYLASACQRLALADRWEIVAGLLSHAEDADDHNLPLMAWYAAEPLAEADPSRALQLAAESKLPRTLAFMTRRVGALGRPETIALLVDQLGKADRPADRLAILEGINASLAGKRQVPMPESWPNLSASLRESTDPRVRSQALALALTFGDPAALKTLETTALDARADARARRDAVDSLVKARPAGLQRVLLPLIDDPALRGAALRGLSSSDDAAIPAAILKSYANYAPAERRDALATLAARPAFAQALLAAVAAKRVPANDLTADVVRQLRNLKDADLDRRINEVWGQARDSTADKTKLIAQYRKQLAARPRQAPDPMLGRAVYAKTCGTCHVLFGVGGKVGPELTGSNRADLDYILSNVLDPGALIGKDYQAHILALTDGRVLTGIIRDEQADALTLATANETIVVPKSEVEERKVSDQSMMPEGQWEALSDHEVRSLVAYLAAPAQVPMLATKENAGLFGVGRDLSLWDGDPALWSIEGSELVGRSAGLTRNEFLRSHIAADNFRLTFEVRLARNAGNSGLQFRSTALPDGEMKGYQADIGASWWGKLYEENGRGLLGKVAGDGLIRADDWVTYEVTAIGPRIETRLNGQPVNTLDDPSGAKRGIFALQLHSGEATEVRFRNFRLDIVEGANR